MFASVLQNPDNSHLTEAFYSHVRRAGNLGQAWQVQDSSWDPERFWFQALPHVACGFHPTVADGFITSSYHIID